MAAIAAMAGERRLTLEGPPPRMPNIAMPAMLQGKRRQGMSSKSAYAKWRGGRQEGESRLKPAHGAGAYDGMTNRERTRQGRELAAARKANREAHTC